MVSVTTRGGALFGIHGVLKEILKSKNTRLRFAASIKTVTNYLPGYEAKDSESLREKVEAQTKETAEAVYERNTNWIAPFTPLNKAIYLNQI